MTTIHLPNPDLIDDAQVTRFDVERLACGELSGDSKARVERALQADPALQAFYDDVVASDRAFLISQPPAAFLARIQPVQTPSLWSRVMGFIKLPQVVSSAAAAAAVFVIVNVGGPAGDPNQIKGGVEKPSVGFFVQDGEVARIGHAGEELKAGQRIQLAVKDVDKRAFVVVGVDGRGAVSIYAKEQISSTSKGTNKPRLLPASLILDDTTGAERFFVVYGDDLKVLEGLVGDAAFDLARRVKDGSANLTDEDTLVIDAAGVAQASIHILKVR